MFLDERQRMEVLSQKVINQTASSEELREYFKLLNLWNTDVEREQLYSKFALRESNK
jgi:hypothetical protein